MKIREGGPQRNLENYYTALKLEYPALFSKLNLEPILVLEPFNDFLDKWPN